MIDDAEIAAVNAASKALELYDKNPHIEIEEAIKIVLGSLDASTETKIPAVAAVNYVLKLKRQLPHLSDKQIIQRFLEENKSLINQISKEEGI